MLKGRDIIFFGDDWGRHPSTIQHIARVLSRSNRILWVNTLGSRKPRLNLSDLKRLLEKSATLIRRGTDSSSEPNIHVLHPRVLPYYDSKMIRKLNNTLLKSAIRKETKKLRFHKPVLMSITPLMADLMGQLGEHSSHYFCADDYPHFDNVFSAFVDMEQTMLDRSDTVFVTSEILLATRHPKRRPAKYLPQGVDIDHFKQRPGDRPEELATTSKSVVGFFGLITTWVDVNLIARCAQRYPDATFIVIGRATVDTGMLSALANVRYLGAIPYASLPKYAQVFDVGLIPFIRNPLTLASNPLKMLEYLSMGAAVVSTDLPEVHKFGDVVYIAKDNDDFVEQVGIALMSDSPARREERRRRASAYSWMAIAERVSIAIDEAEHDKN